MIREDPLDYLDNVSLFQRDTHVPRHEALHHASKNKRLTTVALISLLRAS